VKSTHLENKYSLKSIVYVPATIYIIPLF